MSLLSRYQARDGERREQAQVEEVKRVGAEVAATAAALRRDFQSHALQMRSATERARTLLEVADLGSQLLEQIDGARRELEERLASVPESVPGAVPGSTPGVVDPMPVLYPGGQAPQAFLYGQLLNLGAGVLPLTGGTIAGNLAVGAAGTHRLDLTDGNMHAFWTATPNLRSGSMGLHIDKTVKADTHPHSLTFLVGGAPTWDIGQDFDTSNALNGGTGNSDLVLAFDYTAAANAGADTLRISPEEASSVGTGCKANWGRNVGTPRANSEFLTLTPGSGVGGLRIHHNASTTFHTLIVDTQNAGDGRCSYAFGDASGNTWGLYQDLSASNVRDLTLNDDKNGKTRLTILSNASSRAAFGFGGGNPQAIVSAKTSSAAGDFNAVQRAFMMGFNDTPNSHSLNISQILDAGTVNNYLFMKGSLDATSTVGAPVLSSVQQTFGLRCQDAEMSFIAAPAGTVTLGVAHQPIRLAYTSAALLGFFGASPVARQSVAAAASDAGTTQTLANSIRTLLINLGFCN